jgi:hypothetical protein
VTTPGPEGLAPDAPITRPAFAPSMGSPLVVGPPLAVALLFVALGILVFSQCNGDVSLVWFGLAALLGALVGALFGAVRLAGGVAIFGLLCILVGLLAMPFGCSFFGI